MMSFEISYQDTREEILSFCRDAVSVIYSLCQLGWRETVKCEVFILKILIAATENDSYFEISETVVPDTVGNNEYFLHRLEKTKSLRPDFKLVQKDVATPITKRVVFFKTTCLTSFFLLFLLWSRLHLFISALLYIHHLSSKP